MFVSGFDFGTKNSTIAVAQKGGVDVITNEVSNRLTPSLISFGDKERWIGEPAQTNRFIGSNFADEHIQKELQAEAFNAYELPNGQIGFNVNYLNEPASFSSEAILAMLLGKLKRTVEAHCKLPMREVVISVPGYWNEFQRRAILNAGTIAGLNITRIMNENTATALSYGIYKDLPEAEPIKVLFIDVGDSSTSVSAVSFKKGQLNVLANAYDAHTGGRNLDATLVNHFAAEFKKTYKIDIFENKKALIRTQVACEKLKKTLSSNNQALISIDSLMEDKDVKGMMDRKTFEELVSDDLDKVLNPLKQVLAAVNMTADQFTTIEITGGGTRSTSIQKRLTEFLGRELSKTINSEESVCRGCSLQCAMLSPVFKVRPFAINDIATYPINVTFKSASVSQNLAIFNLTSPIPSPKPLRISFPITKAEPFQMIVTSTYGTLQTITVALVPTFTNKSSIKAKVWLDIHGVFHMDEIKLVEQVPTEEDTTSPAPAAAAATSPKEDVKMGEEAAAEEAAKKVKVRETSLSVDILIPGSTAAEIAKATEEEGRMQSQDLLATETADRKNALESYIYDMRSKITSSLAEYATKEESATLISMLTAAEDWLYGEGEDTMKSQYVAKYDEIAKIGNPIAKRRQDREDYPDAVVALREVASKYKNEAMSPEEKYEHISQEDKEKIIAEADSLVSWIENLVIKQESVPKTQPCIINIAEVNVKRMAYEQTSKMILNKPKPKPVPVATPAPETATPPPATPEPTADAQPESNNNTMEYLELLKSDEKESTYFSDCYTEIAKTIYGESLTTLTELILERDLESVRYQVSSELRRNPKFFESLVPTEAAGDQHSFDRMCLVFAAATNNVAIVTLLIDSGANVLINVPDAVCALTPLHVAMMSGNVSITKLLLDRGANPTMVDGFRANAVNYARLKGSTRVAVPPRPQSISIYNSAGSNTMESWPLTRLESDLNITYTNETVASTDYLVELCFSPFQINADLAFRQQYMSQIMTSGGESNVVLGWISEAVGWGVFAARDLKAGEYIVRYGGRITMGEKMTTLAYNMMLSFDDYGLDASSLRSLGGMINHSANHHNAESQCIFESGAEQALITATRFIPRGTQILIDYSQSYWQSETEDSVTCVPDALELGGTSTYPSIIPSLVFTNNSF
eukprot:gene11940-13915_t